MLRFCPEKTRGGTGNANMKKLFLVCAICCANIDIAPAALDTAKIDQLAEAVKEMYDALKQVRAANPQPKESFGGNSLPEKNSISGEPLNKIFGTNGEAKDGMVKFTFGRPATMHGVKIDNTMGVNTWAAFAGTDDNTVVDGDFAVTEDELQAVLKSLVKQKIYIVAIHQHMTHEQPRMIFFHYWGRARANDLAEMVKGAFLIAGLQEVSSPK